MLKNILRRTGLLNSSVPHDNNAVAEGHSFGLVMGDVNKCGVNLAAQLDNFRAHLVAKLCIKV